MKSDELYLPAFGYPVAPWHRWFAWRPVKTVDRGWVWGRMTWKRIIHKKASLPGPNYTYFQYAIWIGK